MASLSLHKTHLPVIRPGIPIPLVVIVLILLLLLLPMRELKFERDYKNNRIYHGKLDICILKGMRDAAHAV